MARAGTCPPPAHSPCSPLPQFRCCGVSNYTDWFEVYNATRVPDSCCLEFSESCGLHAPGTWWKAVSLAPGLGVEGRPRAPVTPALPTAVLRDGEGVAPRKPAGRGCLRAVHSTGSGARRPARPGPRPPSMCVKALSPGDKAAECGSPRRGGAHRGTVRDDVHGEVTLDASEDRLPRTPEQRALPSPRGRKHRPDASTKGPRASPIPAGPTQWPWWVVVTGLPSAE